MSELKSLLRALHQNMLRVDDQQSALQESEKNLKRLKLRIEAQQNALSAHLDGVKNLRKAIHDHEVTLKSKQTQVEKYERQTNEITSKKEFDALKEEIKQTREAMAVLEDRTLEAMSELDAKVSATPQFEANVRLAVEESNKAVELEKEKKMDRVKIIADADAAAKQLIEELPVEIKGDVQRLLKAKGIDGMAPVRKKSCTGCYTALSAQRHMDLMQSKPIYCPSCGRLLYPIEEERSE